MKNYRIIIQGVLVLLTLIFVLSCDDKNKLTVPPSAYFQSDALYVNLNDSYTPPIVCIINSAAGLRNIDMFIVKEIDGEEIEESFGNPIKNFYNSHSYSLSQTPLYSEEMKCFKVVATDVNGQSSIFKLPMTVIPLFGLPEIYFSTDEAGIDKITSVTYIEDSEMPDIYAHFSSQEELKSVSFYQTIGYETSMINNEITFEPETKKAVLNLKTWENGETYTFDKGVKTITAKVVAGELGKSREVSLTVTYKYAVDLIWNQTEEFFNGLPANQPIPVSGKIASAYPLTSFTYTIKNKDGGLLYDQISIPTDADGNFNITIPASVEMDAITLAASTSAGKTNSMSYPMHIGYKYYYLLAGHPGAGGNTVLGEPNQFYSSYQEKILSFCDAKEASAYVDGGFELWSDNIIRFVNPHNSTGSKFAGAGPASCQYTGWAPKNFSIVGLSAITAENFDKATITDMLNDQITTYSNANGFDMITGLKKQPAITGNVAIFDSPRPDGSSKRVILVIDKIEEHDSSSTATIRKTTFWVKTKVEL